MEGEPRRTRKVSDEEEEVREEGEDKCRDKGPTGRATTGGEEEKKARGRSRENVA